MISCLAASQSLRSAWSTSYGMCVAQLWKTGRNGSEPFAQPLDGTVDRVAQPGDVCIGVAL